MTSIAVVVGTRPEAIKLAPLIAQLQFSRLDTRVISTAQHRDLLDKALGPAGITIDYDLDVMRSSQSPLDVFGRVMSRLPPVLDEIKPGIVLVHGDTTTAYAAALTAFHMHLPVGHVEAGLRSHVPASPFPEEFNRRGIAAVASLHFAPTEIARDNLIREGISERQVIVTGNTVVDALDGVISSGVRVEPPVLIDLTPARNRHTLQPQGPPTVLITCHRRENHGEPMRRIFGAIRMLAQRNGHIQFVFPVHPSPRVREDALHTFSDTSNVLLVEPMDYSQTIALISNSRAVFTDSGGIQEEAAILGKRAMIFRDVTERPETVLVGSSTLVGSNEKLILEAGQALIEAPSDARIAMAARELMGDGNAARRILVAIEAYIGAGSDSGTLPRGFV